MKKYLYYIGTDTDEALLREALYKYPDITVGEFYILLTAHKHKKDEFSNSI